MEEMHIVNGDTHKPMLHMIFYVDVDLHLALTEDNATVHTCIVHAAPTSETCSSKFDATFKSSDGSEA